MTKHRNPPEYHEKVVSSYSKGAVAAFKALGCHGELSCLPCDRKRIIFVTCKRKYRNQVIPNPFGHISTRTYGDAYQGTNQVHMRCPLDCAIRGSAYDNGKHYQKVKESI